MSFIIQEQASPVLFEIGKEEATGAGGTIDFYLNDQDFLYFEGNASANFAIDLAFDAATTLDDALNVDDLVTITLAAKNGSTPYYLTNFQIDGGAGAVTINWNGEAPTAGKANEIDYYTFKILKTSGNAYTVFASVVSTAYGIIPDRQLILTRGAGSAETIYYGRENSLFLQGTAAANVTLDLTFATGQTLNSVMATGDVYDFNLSFYNAGATVASAYQLTTIKVDGSNAISNLYYAGNAPTGIPSSVVSYDLELIKIGSAAFNCNYYETDLNNPTFFPAIQSLELLVVAGAGGGGHSDQTGGGGGGGGLLYYGTTNPGRAPSGGLLNIRAGTYTITVGGGGAGAVYFVSPSTSGNPSSFASSSLNVTCLGGGRGGDRLISFAGGNGGCGGGGGGLNFPPGTGEAGPPRQGFDGAGASSGGPGGGARAAAVYPSTVGLGLAYSISGGSVTYSTGGSQQGGATPGNNGAANTGIGGDGAQFASGGNGGKGIVILKYPDIYPAAVVTGSPTVTVSGGFRTYVFNDSGTFTIS